METHNIESYADQEFGLTKLLKIMLPKYVSQNDDFVKFLQNNNIIWNETTKLDTVFENMSLRKLISVYDGEKLNFIIKNKTFRINKNKLDEYINTETTSYVIDLGDTFITNKSYNIFPMHSLGKVFTGMLIMLLINDGIITETDITKHTQLPQKIIDELPLSVKKRINETSFLDLMTHQTGIGDYLNKYFEDIKNNKANPIEPEEYVKYINDDVRDKKFRYSNAGLLLSGISAKYLYTLRTKKNISYNELLKKYIIEPAGITTFTINRPYIGLYNKNFEMYKYVNGSPGGGYWITCQDLYYFGLFCLDKMKIIKHILDKYGAEFYSDNVINHTGALNGSSCWLYVNATNNMCVVVMDIDGKSMNKTRLALNYYN